MSLSTKRLSRLISGCQEDTFVSIYTRTIDAFFDRFLPGSTTSQLWPESRTGDQYNTHNEETTYRVAQMNRLNNMVSVFPAATRMTFCDARDLNLPFPFDRADYKEASPHIVATFPGASQSTPASWKEVCLVVDTSSYEKDDPFPGGTGGAGCGKHVVRLARYARNAMLAHGFVASFVIGLYGSTARIARFDHTSATVSPSFQHDDHPEILQEFLWRFAHPLYGSTVAGSDPTVRKLTAADIAWITEKLGAAGVDVPADLQRGRRITLPGEGGRSFLLLKPLNTNNEHFSRGTTVWMALEDVAQPRICVVKEYWQHTRRVSEVEIYRRLESIPKAERFGLPALVCGEDLGKNEAEVYRVVLKSKAPAHARAAPRPVKHAKPRAKPQAKPAKPTASLPSSDSSGSASVASSAFSSHSVASSATSDGAESHLVDRMPPLHKTPAYVLDGNLRQRTLVRIATDIVGRRLRDFKSTRELIEAMRDAIKGHEIAYKFAGVLHRDVSTGNVMINDDPNSLSRGFLHDFDSSSVVAPNPKHPDNPEAARAVYGTSLNEPTGTRQFIAVEILQKGKKATHCPWHDLESFYWLLTWMVLSYLKHDCPIYDDVLPLPDLFDSKSPSGAKISWLFDTRCKIEGNAPLTWLYEEFRKVTLKSALRVMRGWKPLTHEVVLKLFDEALAMTGWPEDGVNERRLPTDVLKRVYTSYRRPIFATPAKPYVTLPPARRKPPPSSSRPPPFPPPPIAPPIAPTPIADRMDVAPAHPPEPPSHSPARPLKRSLDDDGPAPELPRGDVPGGRGKRQKTERPRLVSQGGFVRRLWDAGSRIYGLFV